MAARKAVSKRSTPPVKNENKKELTPTEQQQINSDWEKKHGVKPVSDVDITEDFYNYWGGKGSSLPTLDKIEKQGGNWHTAGFGNVKSYNESKKVGTLPLRKLNTSAPKSDGIQKRKTTVPVEVKYKKETKVKSVTKGGKPGQRLVTNVKATAKNIVGPAKFKREEKLSGAYERQKAGLTGTSKEKIAELKGQRKYLRSAEMKNTKGMTPQELRGERKSIRQAEKYIKKEAKGKIKYFTKAALGKTMEVTDSKLKTKSKKIQAGKVRYS